MAKVMTKSQVVAHLAEKTGIQKKAAAGVLEELVGLATKEAKSSGQFVIPGLGKADRRRERRGWAGIHKRANRSKSRPRR